MFLLQGDYLQGKAGKREEKSGLGLWRSLLEATPNQRQSGEGIQVSSSHPRPSTTKPHPTASRRCSQTKPQTQAALASQFV